jgi:hypothetical protein
MTSHFGKVGKTATKVVHSEDGAIIVTYHATNVVTRGIDGTITLDTGGWFTKTTKERMNQASDQFQLGYKVWQERGAWFVRYGGNGYPFDGDTITFKVGE